MKKLIVIFLLWGSVLSVYGTKELTSMQKFRLVEPVMHKYHRKYANYDKSFEFLWWNNNIVTILVSLKNKTTGKQISQVYQYTKK